MKSVSIIGSLSPLVVLEFLSTGTRFHIKSFETKAWWWNDLLYIYLLL